MTDRFNTITVVLEKEMRDDDAAAIIAAIRQIRGVLDAKGNVSDMTEWMAQSRARRELGEKLLAILYPGKGES